MNHSRRTLLGIGAGSGLSLLAGAPSAAADDAATGPALDARRLGVDPHDTADQTAALQSALDRAAAEGAPLFLPAGRYRAQGLRVSRPTTIIGVPGLTRLVFTGGRHLLLVEETGPVALSGLVLDGDGRALEDALLVARNVERLTVEACLFRASAATGLSLAHCSGHILRNTVEEVARTAVFAIDSEGLEIAGNHIRGIGNNGIQVWRSSKGEDGTRVIGNRIEGVRAEAGGSGQYGNGINVFRAGGVTVADNYVTDCAFTAVRANSADAVTIANNRCMRLSEVALFVEFAFEGAVVTGNLVEDGNIGISITNFNDGGRLAVCANNILRRLHALPDAPESHGIGIAAQADTVVSGNVVEDAANIGITLGWGPYLRDVSATGNIVRNTRHGIRASVTEGAGRALITDNIITGARDFAIVGHDHGTIMTGELAGGAAAPAHLVISNNLA